MGEMEQDPAGSPAMAGWPTRSQVARQLDVAIASVRRLEGTRLHPVQNQDGVWLFDPDEVATLASERGAKRLNPRTEFLTCASEGELAALVFGLLDQGRSFRELVKETAQPPEVIRDLFRQWRAGFVDVDASGPSLEADLDAQRARDDREMREWEARMLEIQKRQIELDFSESTRQRRAGATTIGSRVAPATRRRP